MTESLQANEDPQVGESEPRPVDLDSTDLYVNRELSWLQFNERVLELAGDERTPLLERVKFLAIYASNLDEFYMVRVAGLLDQVDAGIDARKVDGLSPTETIARIASTARRLGRRHDREWTRRVQPELAAAGIRVGGCADCSPEELVAADSVFVEQVLPVLTPLAVGPSRPFPYISNLSLSIAVRLRDPATGDESFARVKVPREALPRFLTVGASTFVALEDVIARHLEKLFLGMEVLGHGYFRVTRDADFTVSDEADDLLRAVEDELRRRRFGEIVRLEVSSAIDSDLCDYLIEQLAIETSQVVYIDGLLAANDLWQIHGIDGYHELRDEPWVPVIPPALAAGRGDEPTDVPSGGEPSGGSRARRVWRRLRGRRPARPAGDPPDVFAAMRAGDVLVHRPYHSFADSVERFVRQAVADPDVLAIKMTVYRTSDDSALVPALIEAAERGKQAVCLVELKARFDEWRNIGWARALEKAGAHVIHGVPGLKIHAKALLVVRREDGGVRHYVHVGTGNYHAETARLYEDFGFFTCDPDIAADVAALFNTLTSGARPPGYRKAIVAPEQMRQWVMDEIARTVEAQRSGERTRIVMKVNSLVDARCTRALYEASQAGVPIDLIVRGICRLRAGVPGVSETIRVVSVVGRFLEHSRIYGFHRGDAQRYWIGSADLMPRNLDARVELLVPIDEPALRAEVIDDIERCLADDSFGWELGSGGLWRRRDGNTRSVHRELIERAA
ncbi:MAG: polyphosphate kinase 1, partial [Solirubrobacteraceae bacterium]